MKTKRFEMRLSENDYEIIQEKMGEAKIQNMSAFMRKMALEGYVVVLQMDELKEVSSLLKYIGNNINQTAKRLNESKNIYPEDFKNIEDKQDKIIEIFNTFCLKLARL